VTFVIHANLDCEARWAGVPLPLAVQQRISLLGALVAALAPSGAEVEVWTPVAVDPARLLAVAGWTPPALRVGTPPRADLAWADPAAKAVNDRRLAVAVGATLGATLPGVRVLTSVDELAGITGRWVAKAPWTSAGRDRCHGGGPPTDEQRRRLARMLARFGGLVVEPWMDRVLDVGVCATVRADGAVIAEHPHGLLVSPRGQFLAIDLGVPALDADERRRLAEAVTRAGAALFERGFTGPFAIDAFAYHTLGERRFHPLCEINARYSFGWIARALHARLGLTRLGFGAPPAGATVLIAPAADGVTAWCA